MKGTYINLGILGCSLVLIILLTNISIPNYHMALGRLDITLLLLGLGLVAYHLFGERINFVLEKSGGFKILSFVILLAFLLGFYRIGELSLWYDEIQSVVHSGWCNSLECIIRTDTGGVNPPLYAILLYFWFKLFGITEFTARFFSLLVGVLVVISSYLVGKTIFNQKISLLATLLISVSTMFVRYSQEARTYMLFTLASLLMLYFFYVMTIKHRTGSFYMAGFVLSNILNIYTNYYAFSFLAAEVIYFVLYYMRDDFIKKHAVHFIMLFTAISLIYVPWFYHLITRPEEEVKHGPVVLAKYVQSTSGFHLGNIPAAFIMNIISLTGGVGSNRLLIVPVFYLLFLYGTYAFSRERHIKNKNVGDPTVLLALWLIVPFAGSSMLTIISPMSSRYLLPILPLCLLFVAKGIMSINNNNLKALMLLIMLSLSGYYLINYYSYGKDDWRAASSFLIRNMKSNDSVAILPDYAELGLRYYGVDSSKIIGVSEINRTIPSERMYSLSGDLWVLYSEHLYDPGYKTKEFFTSNCLHENDFLGISIYLCDRQVYSDFNERFSADR